MKELGYGSEYRYSHDFPGHFTEQEYLPENLKERIYYDPTDLGEEKTLGERLRQLWPRRRSRPPST